jgi:hypothetical protein
VAAALLWFRRPASPVAPRSPATTAARVIAEPAWPVPDGSETAVVEVLNGTGRAGLARTAARLLRSRGIDVLTYGNGDSAAKTIVLVRRGDQRRGRLVSRALGVGEVRDAPDSTRRVDVTVILGHDFAPELPLHP